MKISPRPLAMLASCAAALALPVVAAAESAPEAISTLAGSGPHGFAGDLGPAVDALLDNPRSVSIARDGSSLIADSSNHRIRRVSPEGKIETVAGTGFGGFNGDALPPDFADLNEPHGVAATADGGFLIADTKNHRVRKVHPHLGLITTVAGNGLGGYGGDGAAASLAQLNEPAAVAPTPDGGFLIADNGNSRVRKVSAGGVITTVAGDGIAAFGGDGGDATLAQVNRPQDVEPTSDGGFLIADTANDRVRHVSAEGIISTVAGDGTGGFGGDGGPATAAQLDGPTGLAAKENGKFYIADSQNHRVRKVHQGIIKTIVGDGTGGFGGDGGPAEVAQLNSPNDIAITAGGGQVVADMANNRIRLIGLLIPPVSDVDGMDVPSKPGEADSALQSPLPPKVGDTLTISPRRGRVRVRLPGTPAFVALEGPASIPVRSVVDASAGSVSLTAASNASGATQTAAFSGGTFKVLQRAIRRPVTELVLRGGDFTRCRWPSARRASGPTAHATAARRVRRLWGSGRGRFRTRGRHGTATVRGTIWATVDRCDGTMVAVRRGRVAVHDHAAHRTVFVRAGRQYLARSRARRSRQAERR